MTEFETGFFAGVILGGVTFSALLLVALAVTQWRRDKQCEAQLETAVWRAIRRGEE